MGNKSSVAQESIIVKTTKKIITNPDVQIVEKYSPLVIIPNANTIKNNAINIEFSMTVNTFKNYLINLKNELISFEKRKPTESELKSFLDNKKETVFPLFDTTFNKLYSLMLHFNKDEYKNHQAFLQHHILDFFVFAPLNLHIFVKPYGYPGDFELMNMIFDTNNNYDGITAIQKLVHNYTGNSVMSVSNIERKYFFINQLNILSKTTKNNYKIGNIGCGSAREIFDFIKQKNDTKTYNFHCIDFEKKALEHVENQYNTSKTDTFLMHLYQHNIIDTLKGKFDSNFDKFDFIYSSGLFDYLKENIAKKLIKNLLNRLNKNGTLIIVNANSENAYQRSYYEMLGEWNFIHRSQKEMEEWISEIKNNISEFHFEQTPKAGYNYLIIKK
jgi:hypothetical protein